jgi:hypothetical protein
MGARLFVAACVLFSLLGVWLAIAAGGVAGLLAITGQALLAGLAIGLVIYPDAPGRVMRRVRGWRTWWCRR